MAVVHLLCLTRIGSTNEKGPTWYAIQRGEAAQRDMATDWIAAYKKYFRTDSPFNGTEPILTLMASDAHQKLAAILFRQ